MRLGARLGNGVLNLGGQRGSIFLDSRLLSSDGFRFVPIFQIAERLKGFYSTSVILAFGTLELLILHTLGHCTLGLTVASTSSICIYALRSLFGVGQPSKVDGDYVFDPLPISSHLDFLPPSKHDLKRNLLRSPWVLAFRP